MTWEEQCSDGSGWHESQAMPKQCAEPVSIGQKDTINYPTIILLCTESRQAWKFQHLTVAGRCEQIIKPYNMYSYYSVDVMYTFLW